MLPAVSIANLTKYYKKFKALDDVSFEVQEGEFFGFLGPNGAGKTTTISAITGLANFQTGAVQVFGHDVIRQYRQTRSLIGLAPQEFNFDPFLSVEQILRFAGGYFGMTWSETRKRSDELLDIFEIKEKRKEGYKKLSGGMKRRLLIARALMHRPKILILDEPTAGVDLELRYQLWDFLKKINKEGITIMLTTHYIEEAEKLCSRIGVIHGGKIVAMDPTETLVRKMSGDQVELYLRKQISSVPPDLGSLPIKLDAQGWKLLFEEKGGVVAQVLKVLHERQIEIEKIDIRRPTLEDAFLKLVSKKQNRFTEY
jgi:ABC-2 type transport system ATP-binding protein